MLPRKVLILGGTREAAELAEELVASGEWRVTTSLAGRTKDPSLIAGAVRIGGFGGADGLADFIRTEGFDRVIDATHPFAKTISANARAACAATGIELETRTREAWEIQPGDKWTEVRDLDEAARMLPAGSRVFLALGRQYLDAFKSRDDCHFVIRMVDMPEQPLGFADHVVIAGKPSREWEAEAALFKTHAISHLVCRNSGGGGGYAKIIAARELDLPVILINRG